MIVTWAELDPFLGLLKVKNISTWTTEKESQKSSSYNLE